MAGEATFICSALMDAKCVLDNEHCATTLSVAVFGSWWGEWHWNCRIMTYWMGVVDCKMGGNFTTMILQSGIDFFVVIVKMGMINRNI